MLQLFSCTAYLSDRGLHTGHTFSRHPSQPLFCQRDSCSHTSCHPPRSLLYKHRQKMHMTIKKCAIKTQAGLFCETKLLHRQTSIVWKHVGSHCRMCLNSPGHSDTQKEPYWYLASGLGSILKACLL